MNGQRIDWGDRRGQFQAYNTLTVRVRDIDQAGAAVTAATNVGTNIVSGPDLRLSDAEAAASTAYANGRGERRASPAGRGATRVESGVSSTIMPGQTTSAVTVQVDFALVEK